MNLSMEGRSGVHGVAGVQEFRSQELQEFRSSGVRSQESGELERAALKRVQNAIQPFGQDPRFHFLRAT
ncbi:MAG: hypothetical protein JO207_03170 [Verrucomicrobia bacterium]|nr:hypothetical protein [Verrucomicrobiota bacterium]